MRDRFIRSFRPDSVESSGNRDALDSAPPIGNRELLSRPLLALLAAVDTPPGLVLPALDLAHALGAAGTPVVGGFQTPLERRILKILLRRESEVVICLSRVIADSRLPREWRGPLAAGSLLVFGAGRYRRPSARSGTERNRVVIDLATQVLIVAAPPGSRTYRAARRALDLDKPVYCMDHPCNWDLQLLGAATIPVMAPSRMMRAGAIGRDPRGLR